MCSFQNSTIENMPPKSKPKCKLINSEDESDDSILHEMPYSCVVWECDGKMSKVDCTLIEKQDKDDKLIIDRTYKVKYISSYIDA